MRLNICQEERDYWFYKNDDEQPYLTGRVFWASSKNVIANIYDLGGRPVAIIKPGRNKGLWGKPTYMLQLISEIIEVSIISNRKGHWTFEYKDNQYNFYMHYGYKKSLFKAGEQVAKYDAREHYPLDPKKAFIVANNDEDDLLLLCLFLLFDKESALDSELPRNRYFLGKEMQEFDHYWFPTR